MLLKNLSLALDLLFQRLCLRLSFTSLKIVARFYILFISSLNALLTFLLYLFKVEFTKKKGRKTMKIFLVGIMATNLIVLFFSFSILSSVESVDVVKNVPHVFHK